MSKLVWLLLMHRSLRLLDAGADAEPEDGPVAIAGGDADADGGTVAVDAEVVKAETASSGICIEAVPLAVEVEGPRAA